MKNAEIGRAANILAHGGTVVFPTETLYGLAASSVDREAVRRVCDIKRRPQEKMLPVIVGSLAQARKYFIFDRLSLALAKKFWPGPLTLVLATRSRTLAAAMGGKRVAVRYSANATAARLAIRAGAPITSTSANRSGRPGCFTISSVKRQLGHTSSGVRPYPDMFLNGGTLSRSLPSTIVQVRKGRVSILRTGKISAGEIEKQLLRKRVAMRIRRHSTRVFDN